MIHEAPSFLAAFFGGLLGTLTPCVYPLIPITLAIIGADKESTKPKAISKITIYTLGIFCTYLALGFIAVYSGSFFGSIWSSAKFRFILGIIILSYGLISLDLFNLRINSKFSRMGSSFKGNTSVGAFITGSLSGILAAPCTGPLLASILTLAASSSNPQFGLSLLVLYAAGFALPFWLLALTPGMFRVMPRSGSWLYGTKILIAGSLIALGFFYLLDSTIDLKKFSSGLSFYWLLVLVPVFSLSIVLGIKSYVKDNKIGRMLSSLSLSLCLLIFFLPLVRSSQGPSIKSPDYLKQLEVASKNNTPMVLEFTADWCIKCKELSDKVFQNAKVKAALTQIPFSVIDLSSLEDDEKRLQQNFQVRGLPAILFICPSGQEYSSARIAEVVEADFFLESFQRAKLGC